MKTKILNTVLFLFLITLQSAIGQSIEEENSPCTGTQGLVVNFDKKSNKIVETACDSLKNLANYIIYSEQPQHFVIIGIYSDKTDKKARSRAIKRAKRVKKELLKLGVTKDLLNINTSYFKPPQPTGHHDWPFYPPHFTYEIGVYIQMDFQ